MSNVTSIASYRFPDLTATPVDDDNTEMQPDGGAIVDLRPSKKRRNRDGDTDFDENMALDMDDADLDSLASSLLEAIEDDERSRSGWLQSYEKSIDLLGVKIEDGAASGALGLTRSTIRAPILLEACIRFQSNARGELLPADGPVKVRIDDNDVEAVREQARMLERDLNHYLTVTATEYYPDFDRMLFHVAFAGCAFRKIYEDPLRGRPVSESVYAPDLIVSQDITDLENATRITHRITMRQSIMRRMQLLGVYRDIDLIQPSRVEDQIGAKMRENQGLAAYTQRPEDQPYDVLECYCEWDLKGFEHTDGDEQTGLPLPYQITIERTSRQVLAIRRNWRKDDPLMRPVPRFVKYGMGSGLGFYDLGFAHILGNSARTLTAIWRLLIDAGMFSNFPGFLMKKGPRVGTTQLRIGPGEAKEIETGSADDIRQAIMPLPYKEPSQVLMEFAQHIEESARQIAGMAEIQVGEGKQEAPVGTTIALIEQATKVMAAVHKRLHQAMGQEFRLLQELFARNPRALWAYSKSPERIWQAGQELQNFDLVPAADPNVASQMERIMKIQGLLQLAQAQPTAFNMTEINKRALKALGFDDVDTLLLPPQPQGAPPPDPKIVAAQIQAQSRQQATQIQASVQQQKNQSDSDIAKLKIAHDFAESQDRAADRASREKIAGMQQQTEAMRAGLDHQHNMASLSLDHAQHQDTLALDHQQARADQQQAQNQVGLDQQRMSMEHAHHEDQMRSDAVDHAAQASQGIAGYAYGGRVMPSAPEIHVHPNIMLEAPVKKKTQRVIEFILDDNKNVVGAKVVEQELPPPDPEIEIITE